VTTDLANRALTSMQKSTIWYVYGKVLAVQVLLILCVAGGVYLLVGKTESASALLGGAAILVGNLGYAFVARPSRLTAKSGSGVLFTHVLAQVTKLFLVLALMLLLLSSNQLAAGWFIAGLATALAGHWLSLMLAR
jgi:hypothetical protein